MPRKHARAENVGHITCPKCKNVAPVRRNTSGKYYVMCGVCGHDRCTLPGGQDFIMDNAELWSDRTNPPAHLPAWIRLNWPGPKHLKGTSAGTEPAPVSPPVEPKPAPVIPKPEPKATAESPAPVPVAVTTPPPTEKKGGESKGSFFF